jgi:hypothetical protein
MSSRIQRGIRSARARARSKSEVRKDLQQGLGTFLQSDRPEGLVANPIVSMPIMSHAANAIVRRRDDSAFFAGAARG